MKLVRGGMKALIARPWTSVAGISGGDGSTTGAVAVTRYFLVHYAFDGIPEDVVIQEISIRYTVTKTGGDGGVRSWFHVINNNPFELLAADNSAGVTKFTNRHGDVETSLDVVLSIKPALLQPHALDISAMRQYYGIRSIGNEASTEWTISNIEYRVIYTPI